MFTRKEINSVPKIIDLLPYFRFGNKLISPNKSGFRLGDSCVSRLLATTYEIYKSFDDGLEVRGVFLDISKAFDKVWHEGLLLKLYINL